MRFDAVTAGGRVPVNRMSRCCPFERAVLLQEGQEGVHMEIEPVITEGQVRESPEAEYRGIKGNVEQREMFQVRANDSNGSMVGSHLAFVYAQCSVSERRFGVDCGKFGSTRVSSSMPGRS
jgi:hypothetical protein